VVVRLRFRLCLCGELVRRSDAPLDWLNPLTLTRPIGNGSCAAPGLGDSP